MGSNQSNSNRPAPKKRRKKRRSKVGAIFGAIFKTLGTILLLGACTGALLACYAVVYVQSIIIPQAKEVVESLEIFNASESSTMYYVDAETGNLVEMVKLYGDEDRIWVEYEDIPQNLINATIAIEDRRFYTHQGVDWKRTAAGVVYMFTGQDIQGGSTITQQLLKNVTKYDDVTVQRKILEIFTALEFEKSHSKEEILEWYLNYIYLGERCNGVYTASLNYFGKELKDLTLAECASLISITNNPSIYNPYRYPENNLYRRNLTLEEMAKDYNGPMITEAERDAAIAEPLTLNRDSGTSREIETYTWYEDQVITEVLDAMVEELGISREAASVMLYRGGLKIITCYDPKVQAYVDGVYGNRDTLLMSGKPVLELESKRGQDIQSAITVLDNRTGHVVAMAGGVGEKTGSRGWNRATDTVRPPGSSIKPISVYGPALDMGLIGINTVFDDVPLEAHLDEEEPENLAKIDTWPDNSYGYNKGLTTVFEAVEDSVNTISLSILQDLVTPQLSFQYLTETFGLKTLVAYKEVNGVVFSDIDRAPLSMGGLTEGVSTYDMAAAYGVFANNGIYREPTTFLQVLDSDGHVLLNNDVSGKVVLKESTVYYVNALLENVVSPYGTGKSAQLEGMTVAGKTGTTSSNNDKWFVGYTPYYTAAVWVGYDEMERIQSNSYLAADMWKQVMGPLHEGLEDVGFLVPEDLVEQKYCKDSGLIATEWCAADPRGSRITTGTFVNGDQPTQYCTAHMPVEVCTASTALVRYDGKPSGVYHLAGSYCPEECIVTIGMLNHERLYVDDKVVPRDDVYLYNSLLKMDNGGLCDVHVAPPYDPTIFDPALPETWPPAGDPNFPDFDITDASTWPPFAPEPIPSLEPTPSPEPTPDAENGTGGWFSDWWSGLFGGGND